jgi:uncharacterized membrane protein
MFLRAVVSICTRCLNINNSALSSLTVFVFRVLVTENANTNTIYQPTALTQNTGQYIR